MARVTKSNFSQKIRSFMDTNRITAASAKQAGEVTTFYSYGGAAPRSHALAVAAGLLAGRGAKTPVLMIDWDLEGPGLHHHFPRTHEALQRPGVLELFEACRDRLRGAGRTHDDAAEALAAEVLDEIDWDAHIERVDDSRPLYLMRAGRMDDSYGERADRLDWDALFCACPALFRSFAARLTRRFGHVLIDCRSGRSAATSVCTALLPDKMVGLFTPDPRSLEGLRGVVTRALEYRCSHEDDQRPLLVYPVPTPVEPCADSRMRWRFGDAQRAQVGYQGALEKLLGECYGLSSLSLDSYLDEVTLPLAGLVGMAPPSARSQPGEHDRFGAVRSVEAILEWVEHGHFPWRPLVEVRLIEAVEAFRARAGDPHAPALVRELARLGQSYLGERGELEVARRLEQHVIALQAGMHAMEDPKRAAPHTRRHEEPPGDGQDDKLSRLQN
jgi:hypothetical protein